MKFADPMKYQKTCSAIMDGQISPVIGQDLLRYEPIANRKNAEIQTMKDMQSIGSAMLWRNEKGHNIS